MNPQLAVSFIFSSFGPKPPKVELLPVEQESGTSNGSIREATSCSQVLCVSVSHRRLVQLGMQQPIGEDPVVKTPQLIGCVSSLKDRPLVAIIG